MVEGAELPAASGAERLRMPRLHEPALFLDSGLAACAVDWLRSGVGRSHGLLPSCRDIVACAGADHAVHHRRPEPAPAPPTQRIHVAAKPPQQQA